ncbi:MAG: hypothetical protein PHE05_04525, partial [Bacilli bacterium]|nr:hypothetical protein [Bacilli bacterium]
NWTRNYNEFQPEVQLQFEEEEYGFYFGQLPSGILKRRLITNNITTTYYSGDQYNNEKKYTQANIDRSQCANNYRYCSTKQQKYPNNDNKKYEVNKSYVYELNNDIYQYVSKPSGYSSHTPQPNTQYIKIGYPNLPVHYSRLAGRYEISLKYTTFGSADKFTKYIFQKVAFPEAAREYHDCLTTYECAYRVYNDFMECDPPGSSNCRKHAGLTVVYRPISLTNPFPGENAPSNGRRRGSNWSSSSDLLKITKNRGLTDPERIYFDRQPMYEITLNTQSILAIRNYNRTTKGGYSDFNLNCVIGQGRECKSNFIRSQFRHLFVTGRCGMSNNWNQCSVEDKT